MSSLKRDTRMSEETIITLVLAFLAAVPPTLVAYAALQQSRLNVKKTEENTALTLETKNKASEIAKKADHVIELTNSNLTAVKTELAQVRISSNEALDAELARAREENKALQVLIARLTDNKP